LVSFAQCVNFVLGGLSRFVNFILGRASAVVENEHRFLIVSSGGKSHQVLTSKTHELARVRRPQALASQAAKLGISANRANQASQNWSKHPNFKLNQPQTQVNTK
jgi:hypothetical protein